MAKITTVMVAVEDLTADQVDYLRNVVGAKLKLRPNGCMEWGMSTTPANSLVYNVWVDKEHNVQYRCKLVPVVRLLRGFPTNNNQALYKTTCGNPHCLNPDHQVGEGKIFQKDQVDPDRLALAEELYKNGHRAEDIIKTVGSVTYNTLTKGLPKTTKYNRERFSLDILLSIAEHYAYHDVIDVMKFAAVKRIPQQWVIDNGWAFAAISLRVRRIGLPAMNRMLEMLVDGKPSSDIAVAIGENTTYVTLFKGALNG